MSTPTASLTVRKILPCLPEKAFRAWTDRSVVKVAFNAISEGRTEIVLTHELISDPGERENHAQGWARIIDNMAVAMVQP